jgi:NTE family protein
MKTVSLLVLVLFLSLASWSQQNTPETNPPQSTAPVEKPRQKIALVLEGGGALGLAHIGVLEWFEQHHIPVDEIAGTSMGGLVGGLYATGMRADQVADFARGINWTSALRDQTPYRDRSFRRKEDKREFPADLEFGLKGGVSFPSGFNSGQEVGLILDRAAAPYYDLKTFDELPTPFRCVATDLVSGKPVTFDRGSLVEALRATMSLPGIFSPVREKGSVFVDGGLLNNLPVDVARQMGSDIVIAVHLKTPLLKPQERLSALGVLQTSVGIVISANELASMEKADILISASTESFNTLEYSAIDKLIAVGADAAAEKANVLERFALNDEDWKAYTARRQAKRRPNPVPTFVKVAGASDVVARGLQNDLKDEVGKPLDYEELDKKMDEIAGLGRFARASFRMIDIDGKPGLLIKADEKDYGPPLVNPLIVVDGSDPGNVRFALGARITLLDVGGFGSEWRNDFIFGSQYTASSEYYRPFRWTSPFFVAPRLFATTVPFDLYDNDTRVASYHETSAGGGLDFGIAFNRFSQLRAGYQVEHLQLTRQIGSGDLPNLSGRQGFSRLLYRYDNTDDATLPRQGLDIKSRLEFYDSNPGATEHYPLFELQTGWFQRTSDASSIFLRGSGGTTFGRDDTGIPPFSLGGPLRLGAYDPNEILTNEYFLLQPGYIRRLTQLSPLFGNNIYGIASYEIGKTSDNLFHESRLPNDVNVAIMVQTFLGPVVFGGSVGDSGHRKFYFQVGRYF